MVNYKDGKIYKIVCNVTGKIYIGSTCKKLLSSRLAQHNYEFKNHPKCSSRVILENNNYNIILIELFSCDTKDELLKRERYYIEQNECVNIRIDGRTDKQYYIDNRVKLLENVKQYREKNKDKIY